MKNNLRFSQRHPFWFGLFMFLMAIALIIAAIAIFVLWHSSKSGLSGKKLGQVNIKGPIYNSKPVVDWIVRLQEADGVKGVLVRINSPGGMVAPSQEIYQALRKLAGEKPVVVSMGAVAASGGYYVACAADTIVANPGTITGSIGVKATLTNVQELMRKIGVQDQTVVSGELKDAGSITHPLTPKEKEYFQELINDLFAQFVRDVSAGRNMQEEQVRELADGRAYTGSQALELGLVDRLGGRQEAIAVLKKACKIEEKVSFVQGPEEEFSILSWILGTKQMQNLKEQIGPPYWQFSY